MAIPSFDIEASFRAMTVRQPTEEEKIDIVRPDLDIKYNQQLLKMKRKSLKECIHKYITFTKMFNTFKKHRVYKLIELEKKKKWRGQKKYAIDFMKQTPTKMVKQGDLLLYCDNRRYKDTNGEKPNFKDNSRGIEQLRKDTFPNCWVEKKINGELYFIYLPELQELVSEEIINQSKHKNQTFSDETITKKLSECNFKCELTGLPLSEGHLAADHWIPKESGGKSEPKNCVILNKILNEKKNKCLPTDWFCKNHLTNFLTICKKTGMDIDQVKRQIFECTQEFS